MQKIAFHEQEPVRLNKFLAQSGVCSRREADSLIANGHVLINDQKVEDAGRKLISGDMITLLDEASKDLDARMSILYHKPIGIVSSQPEAGEIPAIRMLTRTHCADLKPFDAHQLSLSSAGRLDKDSRGLLILSNDGTVSKALIAPDSRIDKEYEVMVRGDIFEAKLKWLRHGLELDGRKLKPAVVEVLRQQGSLTLLKFILKEGRNRQIRRMCDMCELRVTDLLRTRSGPITLGTLKEGQWRTLTNEEKKALLDY